MNEDLARAVAELLPYALAGAEALDQYEPYGLGEMSAGRHAKLCDQADAMVKAIRRGDYGPLVRT